MSFQPIIVWGRGLSETGGENNVCRSAGEWERVSSAVVFNCLDIYRTKTTEAFVSVMNQVRL